MRAPGLWPFTFSLFFKNRAMRSPPYKWLYCFINCAKVKGDFYGRITSFLTCEKAGFTLKRHIAEPRQISNDQGNGTGNNRGEEPGQKNPLQGVGADRVDPLDDTDAQNSADYGLGT